MKNGKKVMTLLAVILVISMLIAGCSSKNGADNNKSTTSTSTKSTSTSATSASASSVNEEQQNPFEKHLEITWIAYNYPGFPAVEDNPVVKLLEERYNITINIPKLDNRNMDQLNLFFAEGGKFDVLQTNSGHLNWMLAKQGIIRPISEEMLRENMPEYMKITESLVDPDIVRTSLTYDGKYWGIPYMSPSQRTVILEVAREDWMENVGITKDPETVDEYFELLKKFTYEDPDRNNKDDTYGIHGSCHGSFNYLFGAYGVYPLRNGSFFDWDGTVVYSSATDEYKEMLKTLQSWYRAGVIDPEFVTESRNEQRAKWADGKHGVTAEFPAWLASTTVNNVLQMVTDKNPNARFRMLKPFKGPNGKSGGRLAFPDVATNATYFGANTSDEIVERFMLMYEDIIKDREFFIRCYYGVEGEDFVYAEDGAIIPITMESDKIAELGIGAQFVLMSIPQDFYLKKMTLKEDRPFYEFSLNLPAYITGDPAFVMSGASAVYSDRITDIGTINSEFYYNAITSDMDIDKEWDAYIESLKRAGLDSVLQDLEKLIIR